MHLYLRNTSNGWVCKPIVRRVQNQLADTPTTVFPLAFRIRILPQTFAAASDSRSFKISSGIGGDEGCNSDLVLVGAECDDGGLVNMAASTASILASMTLLILSNNDGTFVISWHTDLK